MEETERMVREAIFEAVRSSNLSGLITVVSNYRQHLLNITHNDSNSNNLNHPDEEIKRLLNEEYDVHEGNKKVALLLNMAVARNSHDIVLINDWYQ